MFKSFTHKQTAGNQPIVCTACQERMPIGTDTFSLRGTVHASHTLCTTGYLETYTMLVSDQPASTDWLMLQPDLPLSTLKKHALVNFFFQLLSVNCFQNTIVNCWPTSAPIRHTCMTPSLPLCYHPCITSLSLQHDSGMRHESAPALSLSIVIIW